MKGAGGATGCPKGREAAILAPFRAAVAEMVAR